MDSHNPVRAFAEKALIVPLLSACAALVIRTRRPLVIAVTGSVGKTTTKETIAGVLMHPASRATLGRLRKTPGNMNTNLGIALVVLGYEDWFTSVRDWVTQLLLLPFRTLALATVAPYPDVLVLEIAAGSVSSVPRNCRIVRPRIGALTEIGPAHLDYFGTIENILRAKGALVRAIPPSGLVVLNRSNPVVAGLAAESRAPVVEVQGRGTELAQNIARAIARHLGVPDTAIEDALRDLEPVRRRLDKRVANGMTIIDDAFNANPLSMKLALDVLAESAPPGARRVAILGTMRELGSQAVMYHEEIGAYARSRADLILGVGEHAEHYSDRHVFPDSHACAAALGDLLRPGDVVLIKGSAVLQLDVVVKTLKGTAVSPVA
jgi:UDP-N-acetylmuramoyl-tripeptide--D-alanyl-D-alanine ligase